MKLAAIAAAIAVLLIAAAPADAGWQADRSLAIAQTVWHPTCGQLRLAYGNPATAGAVPEAGGWAWAGNCTIGINADRYYEFEELCSVVLHEAGHVAGMSHSDNPASTMYAAPLVIKTTAVISGRTVTQWAGIDPRCQDRGRPFLERFGLLTPVRQGLGTTK